MFFYIYGSMFLVSYKEGRWQLSLGTGFFYQPEYDSRPNISHPNSYITQLKLTLPLTKWQRKKTERKKNTGFHAIKKEGWEIRVYDFTVQTAGMPV
jgi:hypothetical protein